RRRGGAGLVGRGRAGAEGEAVAVAAGSAGQGGPAQGVGGGGGDQGVPGDPHPGDADGVVVGDQRLDALGAPVLVHADRRQAAGQGGGDQGRAVVGQLDHHRGVAGGAGPPLLPWARAGGGRGG